MKTINEIKVKWEKSALIPYNLTAIKEELIKELRKSAIEDVKRFKKDIEYEEQQAELDKGIYYVVRCVCLTRIFELKAKIEYIIEKFNLTEEDLK